MLVFCLLLLSSVSNVDEKSFSGWSSGLELKDILPEDYDKMQTPKVDGNPTDVHVHMTITGLDAIDESAMTFDAEIFLAQSWKDQRLHLPQNMSSEYLQIDVEWLQSLWQPDSFFKNAKSVSIVTSATPAHYTWLYKDKTVLYMAKMTLTISNYFKFQKFPHDKQEMKLQLETLSTTTKDVLFKWDPDVPHVVHEHIELAQFKIVNTHPEDCTIMYSTGNFTCVELVIDLERRLAFYFFQAYLPMSLIVMISWFSFWARPDSVTTRFTVCIASLLSFLIQNAMAQISMPTTSYLKSIDYYSIMCLSFVCLALIECCVVFILFGNASSLPATETENTEQEAERYHLFEMPTKNTRLLLVHNIDRLARIIFPALFSLFLAIYWFI